MPDVVPLKKRRGRPPKSGREATETRAALLRTAMEIGTEKGFSGVGLDEMLKAVGVPKGSFYHWFDSKEAFGLAVIDTYGRYFAGKLDRHFGNVELTPRQRLQAFFDDARRGMARHDFTRGCLVGNLGQEIALLPGSFRQALIDTFLDWEARTEACLRTGVEAGEFRADLDCARQAKTFWIGWEGAVLRAKLERQAAPLDAFATTFLQQIEA
ncbi:MAG: TetR/AcrR family transcriptional repressor of nem operon [Limimaricola cinnabarinus]|jgi:TetR/AcrR family transcriptional repressor of nem operon|uniref:acrylate utilization transcriptional regulator AcuR n=1 Tax=Limimaricola cinnabarinus TaxID=1125964 RepID=UPI0039E419CD